MAIQIDYFAASTDDEAAATINLEAGPRSESSDVVPSQDVDPGLALGYLNEVLTGVPVEEFLDGEWPALVAQSNDEQRFVLQVDPGFVTLMTTREGPYDDLAHQWAKAKAPDGADEWAPDSRDLADFLNDFAQLCFRAMDEGDRKSVV